MTLVATPVIRRFSYQGIVLDDPGPDLTPEQVRDIYAAAYGELTTAEVICHGIENGQQTYEFKKKVGDKG